MYPGWAIDSYFVLIRTHHSNFHRMRMKQLKLSRVKIHSPVIRLLACGKQYIDVNFIFTKIINYTRTIKIFYKNSKDVGMAQKAEK